MFSHRMPLYTAALLLGFGAREAGALCWAQAAQRSGVAVNLLYAIAQVESGLDPRAVNRQHIKRSGSYDIGLMQVNSSHLPMLAKRGIQETDLFNACTNLQVGAELLAGLFTRYGRTWNAVGAYNAACTRLRGQACTEARRRYAWKVYRQLSGSRAVHAATLPSRRNAALSAVKVAQ